MPGSSTSQRWAFPSCFLGAVALHLAAGMALSLGLRWVQEPGLPKKNSSAGGGRLFYSSRPVLFALFPMAPAAGWADIGTMKDHIEAHLSGNPCGEVPPEWPRSAACTRCWVCGLGVSVRGVSHLPTQPGPPWRILQQPCRLRHFLRCRKSIGAGSGHSVTHQQKHATCGTRHPPEPAMGCCVTG